MSKGGAIMGYLIAANGVNMLLILLLTEYD